MRKIRRLTNALSLLFATLLIAGPVTAQQVTGTLGSPTATTTLSGKQLPPPDPKFGGVIKQRPRSRKPGGHPAWCRRKARPTCC